MPYLLWLAGWLLLFLLLVLRPKNTGQVAAVLLALLVLAWSLGGLFYVF